MIHINQLQKFYGKVKAVDGIDLSVDAGELFAFLGPNGAGKTTTIRILTGLTRIGCGRVTLGGHDIVTDAQAAKRQCGLVTQHINLDSELSVRENLDLHGRLFAMDARRRRQKIEELLSYVELLDRADSLVKQLSGGLKRRLMIARALMHEPKILFLDEPTVGLDPGIRRRIWALIKRVQQDGATIFLTTHYIEEAEFLAGRVAFLDQGRIVALDNPQHLMARLGHWAVDQMNGEGMQTLYFADRDQAAAFTAAQDCGFTLRRVNLEDAFLSLTGKKVVS
ncbi:ABC transporter related protein [Desulfobulbus propionicus DSM 2032]|uniref:ABC transporter related protein n=1 Tax=Desulfobulbus propionicus (strain ATCC 33891 / DSM 2032 / VKM B-1956 / 1pr3) TaxID=577650 RepID=A0A7U3YPN3_DESPD|nr:ABC transporter ATP-binding protein [Desulfobulbus propionicus]ADW19240.1 ABC transporter related protein [Desulfobulbus propionicus DSM 2032]